MRIRIQHDQQKNLFSAVVQTLRHFQRYQAPERIPNYDVRTIGAASVEGLQVVAGHVFDTLERLASSIYALCLDPVYGIGRINTRGKLRHLDRAGKTMRN